MKMPSDIVAADRAAGRKCPRAIVFIEGMGKTVCHRAEQDPAALIICVRSYRVARRGVIVTLPRQALRILLLLCAAQGRPISISEFVDLLYGSEEDGGPDSAAVLIRKFILDARLASAAIGVSILRVGGGFCAFDAFSDEAPAP